VLLISEGNTLKGLWVPISAAVAQQRKVETIANNVANANTAGFKKEQLVFREHLTALERGLEDIDLPRGEWQPKDFYHSSGAEHAQVKVDGSWTIHQQGQLSPTGNPLDLGIQGKGFFEVLTPNGVRYTRKGNFTLSKDGYLVTDQGNFVLSKLDQALSSQGGEGSAPSQAPTPMQRRVRLPKDGVSINNQGDVYAKGGGTLAKLSVVEFKNPQALKKEGGNLFISTDNSNIIQNPGDTKVHQGFLEGSNVNPMLEMAELIKANRHFNSILKAMKAYDAIEARAVNDIAKW